MGGRPFGRASLAGKRKALREHLFNQQGGLCYLCHKPMTLIRGRNLGNPGNRFATFDHVVPSSEGGTSHAFNLKLACRRCNSSRNSRPLPTHLQPLVAEIMPLLNTPLPSHKCHWPGCQVEVDPKMWGCKKHWFRLPQFLRKEVWRTYVPGQEITKTPSMEYIAVAEKVQAWCDAKIKEGVYSD